MYKQTKFCFTENIYRKYFVAIREIKPVLILNKPIYVGFSILDLIKSLMHEFHYKYIKSKFDGKLLFTDTESLVYEIKTEDVFEDFYQEKNLFDYSLFDYSDYSLNSKFLDPDNKKVIGKMKNEFKGKITNRFVGLESKMYSLISVDDEEVTKTKRVNKKIGQRIC